MNFVTNGAEIRAWNINVITLAWMLAKGLQKKKCSEIALAMQAFPETPKRYIREATVTLVQSLLRAVDKAHTEPLLCVCSAVELHSGLIKTSAYRSLHSHFKIPRVGWAPLPTARCGMEISRKGRVPLLLTCPFFPYTRLTSPSTSQNSGTA